jgi:hypothetical protein
LRRRCYQAVEARAEAVVHETTKVLEVHSEAVMAAMRSEVTTGVEATSAIMDMASTALAQAKADLDASLRVEKAASSIYFAAGRRSAMGKKGPSQYLQSLQHRKHVAEGNTMLAWASVAAARATEMLAAKHLSFVKSTGMQTVSAVCAEAKKMCAVTASLACVIKQCVLSGARDEYAADVRRSLARARMEFSNAFAGLLTAGKTEAAAVHTLAARREQRVQAEAAKADAQIRWGSVG